MAPNPALAQLKDIQTPEAIGAWPFAIGIWVLLFTALLLVISAIYFYKKVQKQSLIKKAAILELTKLNINDAPEFAIAVNAILKRAALSYLNRNKIASTDDEYWFLFLDQTLPVSEKGKFSKLFNKRYSKQGLTTQEKTDLLALAKLWLQKSLPLKPTSLTILSKQREAKC